MKLWIYISKNPNSLEIKAEEFLRKFQKEGVLHLKIVNFDTLKTSLLQSNLFVNYNNFIFEEYTGELSKLEILFKNINFGDLKILITIHSPKHRLFLEKESEELLKKIDDKKYWLYDPSEEVKRSYIDLLFKKHELNLSLEFLRLLLAEKYFSCIQIKGVAEQLKIFSICGEKITKELLINSICSNRIYTPPENLFEFLQLYLTCQIEKWVIFFKKLDRDDDSLFNFLRYFGYSLNSYFWNEDIPKKSLDFIRELSYNFLIFIESQLENIFKIRRESTWPVFHFLWSHRPLEKLELPSVNFGKWKTFN